MKAVDNCLVVWSARVFCSNRNDQEGEHTQLFMLDQIRILFKIGFFWTTKEGIPVKMEMYKAGDRKFRMTAELTNLRIEKQDPALFEIPSGYIKNDMGAMMDMGNMLNMDEIKKSAQQRQSTAKPPPERQDVGKTLGEQLPADVNKIIKGLFGQ